MSEYSVHLTTMTIGKARCATCSKEKAILKCEGCLQTFCFNHVADHRQELNKQLEDVEVTCDLIRERLTEQTTDSQKHPLLQKINEWEENSIDKIRTTAEEARQLLIKHTIGHIAEIEGKLSKVANQIRQSRQENDFFETDVRQWKDNLTKIKEELPIKPSNITLRQDPTHIVTKIYLDVSEKKLCFPLPHLSLPDISNLTRWTQNGLTIAGGNGSGHEISQLYNPLSLCVDDDQTVYIADYWNNRIMKWKSGAIKGEIVVNGTSQRNRTDQLNCPRDVIIDKKTDSLIICDMGNRQVIQWPRRNGIMGKTMIFDIDCWGAAMDSHGYLYVSDYNKHEVRRWRVGDTTGTVVAGGNGAGNRLDQLNNPTYIFVDRDQSVYVSDRYNHRVMKWKLGAKEGVIVAGNQTEGNTLQQLSHPTGIVIDQLGTVYVADSNNHRVMRWSKGATKGSIAVGGNGHGEQPNQLYNPWGLSFDRQNNLYVADNANHRIQKFNIDLTLYS